MSGVRWPSIEETLLRAIADAVEAQGGDRDDAEDLLDVWECVHADTGPRVAAMRRDAANRDCRCADGGELDSDGGCARCCGLRQERTQ